MKSPLFIIVIITVACGHTTQSQKAQAAGGQAQAGAGQESQAQVDTALNLNDAIKEFKDSAQRETTLDTIKVDGHDTVRLVIRMIKEKPFKLPKEYQGPAELDTVWNMRSAIQFTINGKEIIKKIVEKGDFHIDQQIRKYGILMLPEITKMDKYGFAVNYDIDVPFSEEGTEAEVKLTGKNLTYTIL